MSKKLSFTILFSLCVMLILSVFVVTDAVEASKEKPFGMITEVSGAVTCTVDGNTRKAYVMMPLFDGTVITTGSGGKAVYVRYSNGREFSIDSESTVSIRGSVAVVESGKQMPVQTKSALPLPKNIALGSRKVMSGAVRMRKGLEIQSPKARELLSGLDFEIRWIGVDSEKVTIKIREEECPAAQSLVITVPNNDQDLKKFGYVNNPYADFHLRYGRKYRVEIFAEIDGQAVTDVVVFEIIDSDLHEKVEAARRKFEEELANNPDNDKIYILMADYYRNLGLYRDAVQVMTEYKEKNPDNPYAYFYLGELIENLNNGISTMDSNNLFEKGQKLEQNQE